MSADAMLRVYANLILFEVLAASGWLYAAWWVAQFRGDEIPRAVARYRR